MRRTLLVLLAACGADSTIGAPPLAGRWFAPHAAGCYELLELRPDQTFTRRRGCGRLPSGLDGLEREDGAWNEAGGVIDFSPTATTCGQRAAYGEPALALGSGLRLWPGADPVDYARATGLVLPPSELTCFSLVTLLAP